MILDHVADEFAVEALAGKRAQLHILRIRLASRRKGLKAELRAYTSMPPQALPRTPNAVSLQFSFRLALSERAA
jgi:hypothetical protein